jgi:hypothetical protein
MHTPNVLINVIRHLPDDIEHVKSTVATNRWNPWVHETKNGNPYLVLLDTVTGRKYSVGRWRPKSGYGSWKYRVFYPYPHRTQTCVVFDRPHEVVNLIRELRHG